jgi:hypothetical protein
VGTKAPEGSWKSIDSSGRVVEGPGEGDRPLRVAVVSERQSGLIRVVSEECLCFLKQRQERQNAAQEGKAVT